MKPRLIDSKKWTNFPKEYINQIQKVFHEAFAKQLTQGKLIVEGRIFQKEVLLRVGYLEKGRLHQANFEVSMNFSAEKKDTIDRIYDCIDAAASMMNEYFESQGEVEFPLDWKEYDFTGQRIWVRYSSENSELEAQANALLGAAEQPLYNEEAETEDALEYSTERIEADEESDPNKTPPRKKMH